MLDTLGKINVLLSPKERRKAKLVFLLMLVMAIMETIGVSSVMPFVAVLTNPDLIETNRYLAAVYSALGFTSNQAFLLFLGVTVFGLFMFSLAFKALTIYAITHFSNMRLHSIACRLLSVYLRQPYDFFLERNTSDLCKSILSEVQQVINGVVIPLMKVMSGALVAIALLALLLFVDPLISLLVAVLLGGAYAIAYTLSRKLLRRIGEDRLLANKQRYILASEVLSGIKELKLLGRHRAYEDRFKEPSKRFARHLATSGVISELPQFAIQAIAYGGVLLIIVYLLGRQGGVEGALPLIALYFFAGSRLMPAFKEIFKNQAQLRFSLPVLDSLYNDLMLKERSAEDHDEGAYESLGLRDSIRLDNISYRYPGSSYDALKDISLTIPAGSSVGFVGSTGAGKSTAVDLILGLLPPSSGQVLVDGVPLSDVSLRAWQDNIGYVPQAIYLSDDTIAANIAFGIPADQIDRDKVEEAARAAHIHDFVVSELPQGYDTVVGERGIRLSGGQRQRLAIARALYHNPDVVVFDEATSALDNATEAAVMEAIEELHGRKTVILIAHRLTTVRNCDTIFMLDHGRLAASGSYTELLNDNVQFRQMAEAMTTRNAVSM